MPTHEFKCDKCDHGFEFFAKVMGQELPKQCPKCKCRKDFHQVLGCPVISIRGNLNTLGQLAEHNAKKMGKEQVQIKVDEAEARTKDKKPFTGKIPDGARPKERLNEETPFWRDEGTKPLKVGKMSKKALEKYVMEGKGRK